MDKLIYVVLPFLILFAGVAQSQTHISVSSEQIVNLKSGCPDPTAGVQPYEQVLADGSVAGPFKVPSGLQFIVTDVEWLARDLGFDQPAAASIQFLVLVRPAGGDPLDFPIVYRSYSAYDGDGFATGRDHLTGGIVIDSGYVFDSSNPAVDRVEAGFGLPPPDFCFINIRGYLLDPKKKYK